MAGIPFLVFLAGAGLGTVAAWFPRLCAVAAVVLLVHFLRKRHFAACLLLLAGVLLVVLRPAGPVPEPGAFGYSPLELEGYFVSPPSQISGGYSQRFRITSGARAGAKDFVGEVDVLSGKAFGVGQSSTLTARLVAPRVRLNPGARASEPFAYLEDAAASVSYGSPGSDGGIIMTPQVTVNRIRQRLNKEIGRLLPPAEAALVAAVTTSGRLPGASEIRSDFQRAGLAHLFSISGTHFGFFALVLFGVLRFVLARLPRTMLERMCEHITPSEAAALLTFPFMLAYLFLSGARVPSVRAFVMTGMFLAGLLIGRRGGWLPFLGLAATVIMIIDPQALSGVSFQMSFLAVLFIGMFIWHGDAGPPDFAELDEPGGIRRGLRYVRGLVLITLAASVGLFPLVAYYFHYVSLISPVANLLVGPLVSMVLVPLSLLGAASYELTGYYLTWPLVAAAAKAAIALAGSFASVPMASVDVPAFPAGVLVLYYGGFALWFRYRHRRWLLLVPVLSVALGAYMIFSALPPGPKDTDTMRVTFPDAGRADAVVVELPSGGTLVVDSARSGYEVASYLRMRGIRTIDALVLSHAHADHAGGVRRLIEEFTVSEVWDNGWVEYPSGGALEGIARRSLRRGDVIEGEGFNMLVLHPYEGFVSSEDGVRAVNDHSLVLRLTGGGASFVFSGDIGGDAAVNIWQIPAEWLRADVLKAPHHGQDVPALEIMLDATGAHTVVASATKLTKASRLALKERPGVKVYVTGRDGAVSFLARGGEIKASVYSDALLLRWPSMKEEGLNILKLFSSWPGS